MKKGKVCMCFGLLLIAAALSLTIYNIVESKMAEKQANAVMEQMSQLITGMDDGEHQADAIEESETLPLYERFPEMEMPIVTIDGKGYIGYLYFPDLELTLPVIHDWNEDDLKVAPCRYSGSVYSKDLIIAGHNYRSHFSNVKRLPIGAEVRFVDMDGNQFFYEIVEMEVLDQMAVEEMKAGQWDMTLFTCNYGGKARVTMRCELVKSVPCL